MAKFREATLTTLQSYNHALTTFSAIFGPHFKNIVGGPPSSMGCVLVRLCHSLACVKKFEGAAPTRAKIWFSKKVDLEGYNST